MEDNSYNRKIVQQLRNINNKYANKQQRDGRALENMAISKPTIGRGNDFMMGAGPLSSLLGMVGLGKDDVEYLNNLGMMKGGMNLSEPQAEMMGGNILDSLGSILQTGLQLAPLLALGKPKRGRRRGGAIGLDNREQNFSTPTASGKLGAGPLSSLLGMVGLGEMEGGIETGGKRHYGGKRGGIATGGMTRKLLGARAVGSGADEMEGDSFFEGGISTGGRRRRGPARHRGGIQTGGFSLDDVFSGISQGFDTVAKGADLASKLGFLKGRGKGKMAGISTGGSKGANKWIMHVKDFAKKHNMKYNEAMKDPRCKSSYKK